MSTSGVGSSSSNSNKTTSSSTKAKDDADMAKFKKEAKATLLNMNASNDEVIDFITKELDGNDVSPAKQYAIQQMLEMRSQIASALSNAMRSIYETSQNIIGNLRT